VLLVLFVPDEEVVFRSEAGAELTANAHRFVSRLAARLAGLRNSAAVPDEPDRTWIDGWLHRSYLDFWASLP
jgi:hypothetical protein